MAEAQQLLRVSPGMEFAKSVGSDDEVEFHAGVQLAYLVHCVNGVGGAPPLDLDVADLKVHAAFDRQFEHGQTMSGWKEIGRPLVGGGRAGDKKNP